MEVTKIKQAMQTHPDGDTTKKVGLKKSKSVLKKKVKGVKSQTSKLAGKPKTEKSLLRKDPSKISKGPKKILKTKKSSDDTKPSLTKKPLKKVKSTIRSKAKSATASKLKLKTETKGPETVTDNVDNKAVQKPNSLEQNSNPIGVKPISFSSLVDTHATPTKPNPLSKSITEYEVMASQSRTKPSGKYSSKMARDVKPATSKKIWKF